MGLIMMVNRKVPSPEGNRTLVVQSVTSHFTYCAILICTTAETRSSTTVAWRMGTAIFDVHQQGPFNFAHSF